MKHSPSSPTRSPSFSIRKSSGVNSLHIQTFSPTRKSPRSPNKSDNGITITSNRVPLYDCETLSPKVETINMSNELLLEDTFISHLASLKRIILENSSSSLSNKHDPYLDHKAAQLVNEEVRRTLVKMTSLRGNSEPDAKRHISDKIAAYSYVGANLSNEIERMVAKKDTQMALSTTQEELDTLKEQYTSLQSHCSYMETIHEKDMSKAEGESKELLEKMAALVRRNQTLCSELDMRLRMEEEAHAKYVQLHLQSVNYHSRVNQLVKEASNTIQSRMGFVPGGVKKALIEVSELAAPGSDLSLMQSSIRNSAAKGGKRKVAPKGSLKEGIQLLRASSRSGDEGDDFNTEISSERLTTGSPRKNTTSKTTSNPHTNGHSAEDPSLSSFDIPSSMTLPDPPLDINTSNQDSNALETEPLDEMAGMMAYLHNVADKRRTDTSLSGGDESVIMMAPTGLDSDFIASPITAHRSFQSDHQAVLLDDALRENSGLW